VAAGYGAALLPREEGAAALDARIGTSHSRRVFGARWVWRTGPAPEPATRHMLEALAAIRQR